MLTNNHLKFVITFVSYVLFLSSDAHTIEEFSKGAYAAVFMESKHAAENKVVMDTPLRITKAEYPFYQITPYGKSVIAVYFDAEKLPSRGSAKWMLMGKENTQTFLSQIGLPEGNIVLIPFFPYCLYACVLEYRTLHMTRKECIETQTDPDFYRIFYKGSPLNIFILPTNHSLPLAALHSGIQGTILTIAREEGGRLIGEVDADYYEEEDDEAPSLKNDSRIKIDIDVCVERQLRYFSETLKDIYANNPDAWTIRLKQEDASIRKIYAEGWTKDLDAESRSKLSLLARAGKKTIEEFDQIDPYYVYSILSSFEVTTIQDPPTVIHLQFDTCISDVFVIFGKRSQGLEDENGRFEARREEATVGLSNCPYTFNIIKSVLQKSLLKIPLSDKDFDTTPESDSVPIVSCVYTPTLDDLNFADPLVMDYLRGTERKAQSNLISLEKRNIKWWSGTIDPLLDERVSSLVVDNAPPILLMYGLDHNRCPSSITDLIRAKPGFEVRRKTRQRPY